MATQRIINGPSRWDIMLSFFEDKPITFTLKEGVIVKVSSLFCMWNMAGYEPLVGEVNQWDDAGRGLDCPSLTCSEVLSVPTISMASSSIIYGHARVSVSSWKTMTCLTSTGSSPTTGQRPWGSKTVTTASPPLRR